MTDNWKFSERRIMIKAAILIDPDLRRALIKALTAKPGQCIGLEMKVRSGLTQLFLTKNQDVDEITPQEVISFGSWLSIVIRNVVEKYQGKLYFILFGPTRSSSTGELVDWTYFCDEETQKHSIRKCEPNYKKLLKTLLNGIRALRIMNNSKSSDDWWTGQKIYQLFLRIIGNTKLHLYTSSFFIQKRVGKKDGRLKLLPCHCQLIRPDYSANI